MRAAAAPTTADLAQARAALATVVPRLTALIRGITTPDAPAVGVWSVADVALHLSQAWDVLPALVSGRRESPLRDVWELADFTRAAVRDEGDRDLRAAAGRLDAAASAFQEMTAVTGADDLHPWLVQGIRAPTALFACHLLSESLVHGHDIARAQGMPWTIEPDHAARVLMGFVFPIVARLEPHTFVEPEAGAGVHACYDVGLRGRGRVFLNIDDGALTVEQPSARRVDCHISAAADAMLLLLFGRQSQWRGLLTGRVRSWGRRPWLAGRLRSMLRNP